MQQYQLTEPDEMKKPSPRQIFLQNQENSEKPSYQVLLPFHKQNFIGEESKREECKTQLILSDNKKKYAHMRASSYGAGGAFLESVKPTI
jgi:hypothetical protein